MQLCTELAAAHRHTRALRVTVLITFMKPDKLGPLSAHYEISPDQLNRDDITALHTMLIHPLNGSD
jgi:hypothetical protein